MVRGHQQRRVRGQCLDDAGQQRIDTGRGLVPLGRTDAGQMCRGVQIGGIAIDQARRGMQLVGHPLGVVVARARRAKLCASVCGVGQSAADEPLREYGAHIDAGLLYALEPGWQRLPLVGGRVVAPADVIEHPVGAGDVEREAQDAVLTGLCARAQRHQTARRGRGERAGQLVQPSDPAGQNGCQQRCAVSQLR